MDIEAKLQEILKRYGYGDGRKKKRADIYVLVEKLMRQVADKYQNIAIRCGGRHAAYLLEEFDELLHVKYIIDKNPAKIDAYITKKKIPVIDHVGEEKIDAVIIGTFDYRKEVVSEFANPDLRVIDIYDYLDEKGYVLQEEFYNIYNAPVYKEAIEKRNQYNRASTREEKQNILTELIGLYFDDKDIYSALNCIGEYISCGYSECKRLQMLKAEVDGLIREIHDTCLARKQNDVFWFWQDGMPFDMITEMPFLRKYSKTGLFFEKAYSVTSSTRFVYSRILDEQEEYQVCLEQKSMAGHHITIELMESHGYLCRKITGVRRYPINLALYDSRITRRLMIADSALTEIYWEAVREMLMSDRPVFFLLHTGLETHNPVMAPTVDEYCFYDVQSLMDRYSEKGREKYVERLSKAVKYIDAELHFLFDMIGDKIIKIVMSDHGDVRFPQFGCNFSEWESHVVMTVMGGQLPAKEYKRLFPLSKFRQLLKYILGDDKDEDALFPEEVWVSTVDAYNKGFIEQMIQIGCLGIGTAVCGVMTDHDFYVELGTGEEIYRLSPDDTTNYINEAKYADRIQYLRKKAGHRFIDIDNTPLFQYSYLLYDALGKKRVSVTHK